MKQLTEALIHQAKATVFQASADIRTGAGSGAPARRTGAGSGAPLS